MSENPLRALSPASLAFALLFGLLFLQSAFYFADVSWTRILTISFYSVLSLFVFWHVWMRRTLLRSANKIDIYFLIFVFVVIASLGISGFFNSINSRLAGYLFFMVVVPYACGRCFINLPELKKIHGLIVIFGLAIVPMILADRLFMPTVESGRFPFFGMDHSPLMIGALLAATLIALNSWVLYSKTLKKNRHYLAKFLGYGLLCLIAVFIVWVSARGWLVAGMAGAIAVTVVARQVGYRKKFAVLVTMLLISGLSLKLLPNIDPRFGAVYSIAGNSLASQYRGLGETKFVLDEAQPILREAKPVLGKASCLPFEKADDSIAMRWTLYQEAIAMFLQKPLLGVGAGAYGWYSCTGPGGFPHSTILQTFAELGLLGAGVFIVLLTSTFITLIRRSRRSTNDSELSSITFLTSLFVCSLIADQIYGNYFMTVTTWLVIGIAASLRSERQLESKANV